jgi:uncharacterized membrane protein YgcG
MPHAQVPHLVLAACSDLVATDTGAARFAAVLIAAALMRNFAAACAAALLMDRALAAQAMSSSSSSRRSSSSSDGGGASSNFDRSIELQAMLWQQLEQSGILQQLPALLSSNTLDYQSRMTGQPSSSLAAAHMSLYATFLFSVFDVVKRLQPAFFTEHYVGQQCLVPAMQLSLGSMQYLSSALTQAARQRGTQLWVAACWRLASQIAAPAAQSLLHSPEPGPALALLLAAEQTTQWACLNAVVTMLMGTRALHLAAPDSRGTNSSSSSSSSGDTTSGNDPLSHQHSTPSSAGSQLGGEPTVAMLTSSMPAAYSSVLQQLGCSSEVGMLMAVLYAKNLVQCVFPEDCVHAPVFTLEWLNSRVAQVLEQYCALLPAGELPVQSQQGAAAPHQHLAALHLSMAAASLQWVSSICEQLPTGKLSLDECVRVCVVADEACRSGQILIPEQQASGDWGACVTANEAVAQLSAAALETLLSEWRDLLSSADANSSTSYSSRDRQDSSSCSTDPDGCSMSLLRSCVSVVKVLSYTLNRAAELAAEAAAAIPGQPASPSSTQFSQLPVNFALCCKLLQDCVRLVTAAAVAAPDADLELCDYMVPIIIYGASLLARCVDGEPGLESHCSVRAISGPLTVYTAAAASVGSPDSLQMVGLMFSLLKLFHNDSSNSNAAVCFMAGLELRDVRTTVMAALAPILRAALDSTSVDDGKHPGSSSGSSSSSSSSSTGGNRAPVTVAVPWLVLLGRWCGAAAMLVQYAPGSHESDESTMVELHQWSMPKPDLLAAWQWVQSSLAGVSVWLAAAGTAQQLIALGYPPQDLQDASRRLEEAAHALSNVNNKLFDLTVNGTQQCDCEHCTAEATLALFVAAQQQLQAASRILTSFAIPDVCNNPACSNVCGPSETQLVAGRSCICGGCRIARYCGRDCQRAAWPRHKPLCTALAAAAAAAAREPLG